VGKIALGATLALGAVGFAGASALAQSFERDRNVSVMERPRPEYDALGVPMGSFTAYPAATVGVEYNDNVYATTTATQDDTILKGSAEMLVQSNWSRHFLSFFGVVSHDEYSDLSDENHTDYTLRADGRVDVVRSTTLGGSAVYQQLTEPRTSSSAPGGAAEPIQYSVTGFDGYGTYERGRARFRVSSAFNEYDYDDAFSAAGAVLDQDFRDKDVWRSSLRSDFAVSPDTALFFEAIYDERTYSLQPPAVTLARDSEGYELLAGANFDITNLVRGEIGVGYVNQDYDNASLPSVEGVGLRGNVEWFPTQLTTVSFGASRTVEDSTVTGSSGYLSSNFTVNIDHELMRNVILSANALYAEDDYEGIDRTDDRLGAGLGVTYYVNRYVGVSGTYNYLEQNTSGTAGGGTEYEVNRFGVSLRLKF